MGHGPTYIIKPRVRALIHTVVTFESSLIKFSFETRKKKQNYTRGCILFGTTNKSQIPQKCDSHPQGASSVPFILNRLDQSFAGSSLRAKDKLQSRRNYGRKKKGRNVSRMVGLLLIKALNLKEKAEEEERRKRWW